MHLLTFFQRVTIIFLHRKKLGKFKKIATGSYYYINLNIIRYDNWHSMEKFYIKKCKQRLKWT